jgi:hypothetical protein
MGPEFGALSSKSGGEGYFAAKFYFRQGLSFYLYITVTLTSILSRSPAGVTRLPESYGEQVRRAGQGRGSHYHIEEILNLKPGREIPNPKQQILNNNK